MNTPKTPAEAARDAYYYKNPQASCQGEPGTEWKFAAQAAIDAHIAQVAEGLPHPHEIEEIVGIMSGFDLCREESQAVINLFAKRFAKLQAERDSLRQQLAEAQQSLSGRTVSCARCNELAHEVERLKSDNLMEKLRGSQAREAQLREADKSLSLPPPTVVTMADAQALVRAVEAMRIAICAIAIPNLGEREVAKLALDESSKVLESFQAKYPKQ